MVIHQGARPWWGKENVKKCRGEENSVGICELFCQPFPSQPLILGKVLSAR